MNFFNLCTDTIQTTRAQFLYKIQQNEKKKTETVTKTQNVQ